MRHAGKGSVHEGAGGVHARVQAGLRLRFHDLQQPVLGRCGGAGHLRLQRLQRYLLLPLLTARHARHTRHAWHTTRTVRATLTTRALARYAQMQSRQRLRIRVPLPLSRRAVRRRGPVFTNTRCTPCVVCVSCRACAVVRVRWCVCVPRSVSCAVVLMATRFTVVHARAQLGVRVQQPNLQQPVPRLLQWRLDSILWRMPRCVSCVSCVCRVRVVCVSCVCRVCVVKVN
jgi:hypothetical protein